MGVIQNQSIQSTFIIIFGFVIGAFNILILAPKVLTPKELGLTRIITDAGITLATLCTLGSIPVINKFFPFYKSYLKPRKNDLPFITLIVCMIGFVVMCFAGYGAKDFIVRKFSEKSPLFVEYSYLVYPFAFFMLLFLWLESFSWAFKKRSCFKHAKRNAGQSIFYNIIAGIHLQNNQSTLSVCFVFLYFPVAGNFHVYHSSPYGDIFVCTYN